MKIVVDRLMFPEDIHVLILWTYNYATFHNKGDFARVI